LACGATIRARNWSPTDTGATPRDVFVVQRWDGKPSGDAFIAYPTPEAAASAAAAKNGREFGGRRLDCAVTVRAELYDALTRPPPLAAEMAPGGASARARAVGGWSEGYATAREELDVVLRGKGVPFETTEGDARRFFAGFNVVSVACVGGTTADGTVLRLEPVEGAAQPSGPGAR
jgi:hypothetical protein